MAEKNNKNEEQQMAQALMQASRQVFGELLRKRNPSELVELGQVGRAGIGVLELLHEEGRPLQMWQIAQSLGVTRSTATTLVDNLFLGKFVERIPDTEDRRRIAIELTQAGVDIAERLYQSQLEGWMNFCDKIGESQTEALLAELQKTRSQLETVETTKTSDADNKE